MRAEVQQILDGAARRLLAERLDQAATVRLPPMAEMNADLRDFAETTAYVDERGQVLVFDALPPDPSPDYDD